MLNYKAIYLISCSSDFALIKDIMKNSKDLSEKKISTLLFSYFVPAFVGVTANTLYNIVGRIFIGQAVGPEALSGLTVVFPIMIIIMGFGMLIGIGSGILTSMELGRGNRGKAELILGNGFTLMLIASAILTAVGFAVKDPLLRSFGATENTLACAADYLEIILAGTVFGITGFGMNTSIRSEGNARIAMNSMLISAGLNVALDALFILVLGFGVKGAASAAVISQGVLTIYVLLHFRGKRAVITLRLRNMLPDLKVSRLIIISGMAPFIMQVANSFVQGIFNTQLIRHGGDIAVAVMGIVNSVATLIVMSIVALNMASQPIIGFNHGAGNIQRVRETLILTVKYSTLIATAGFLVVEIVPYAIVILFNSDPVLLSTGVPGLRIFLAMLPLAGFQIVTSNYFQSIGRPHIATAMTLMRQVVLLIPLLFILPMFFGLNGVWMCAPVSDLVNAVFVSLLLKRGLSELSPGIRA